MTELYTCNNHKEDYDFCPICEIERIENAGTVAIEYWKLIDAKNGTEIKRLTVALKEIAELDYSMAATNCCAFTAVEIAKRALTPNV